MRGVILGILLGGALSAQAMDDDPQWNVFGDDDRKPITSTAYPWSTIGYLSTGCTATLVGRNSILTAAHCVFDSTKQEVSENFRAFYPNLINRLFFESSRLGKIWYGSRIPVQRSAADWAIVRLSKPLGEKYGWMGVSTQEPDTVNVAGYAGNFDGGKNASVHQNCKVKKRMTGFFYHDCDMGRGASGGPVFVMEKDRAVIIGVNIAEYRGKSESSLQVPEYSDAKANIAVPASSFIDDLKAALADGK